MVGIVFYPQGKAPGTQWVGCDLGPTANLDSGEEKHILSVPRTELRSFGRPALSLVVTQTGLFWIPKSFVYNCQRKDNALCLWFHNYLKIFLQAAWRKEKAVGGRRTRRSGPWDKAIRIRIESFHTTFLILERWNVKLSMTMPFRHTGDLEV